MQLRKPHLLAEVDLEDMSAALAAWSWLLQGSWSPLLVSASGDVFLANADGRIFRLDTGVGELEELAVDQTHFRDLLTDSELVRNWFLEPVVDELRDLGKILERGQCYGFTVLPVFKEGSYKAENRFVISALEHIRFTGDVHAQIKDAAEGERVRFDVAP